MKLIIHNSSMVPIYEQIIDQIKVMIKKEELKENDMLPSVRSLSKELRISALTVKKAYDLLEADGFVVTVHGKGTYVKAVNPGFLLEEERKEIETTLEMAIERGKRCRISKKELQDLFAMILEDYYAED